MSYRHPLLGQAIGWKFNHQEGMQTCNGALAGWPTEPWPTDDELAQIVTDYEAYRASTQATDDELQRFLDSAAGRVAKTVASVMVDKGICTMAELKAKYRSL